MNSKQFLKAMVAVLVMAMLVMGTAAALHGPAEAAARQEKIDVVRFMLPESESFSQVACDGEDPSIVKVFQGQTGYVIETLVAGYADDIHLMVGVDNSGSVTGITVRKMYETVGLGSRACTDYHFLMQFLDTTGDAEVGQNVDALTGATVTSKAIARGVNAAVAYVTGADVSSGATSWGG